ncbi:hypothetical protein THASP1DRAFT_33716 [Thamnocephalis sphaerospora]|uniref:RBR-type E3 ubiquitin transferase n=1 Tax=Thamnocephalis sphaerospora TaxID=78915 RepID=A0A4P9XH53_9FUNG|nr:hypothetical protein THASP1DRAFT_33716 [Thamnocephalis sphaerospora]|eukprot:RKP04510.1 hypothetical protein THASP1DRAFT_33716 [Thamnocephalis sphaerospora]
MVPKPAELHQCGICGEEFSPCGVVNWAQFATSKQNGVLAQRLLRLDCKHSLCVSCLQRYIQVELNAYDSKFPVVCPYDACSVHIADQLAKKLLTPTEYTRWTVKKSESDPKTFMYCPNKRCSRLIKTILANNQLVPSPAPCPDCKTTLCLRCKTLYHEGMTCTSYQSLPASQREGEDWDALLLGGENLWRRCPNCLNMVEIQSGCKRVLLRMWKDLD